MALEGFDALMTISLAAVALVMLILVFVLRCRGNYYTDSPGGIVRIGYFPSALLMLISVAVLSSFSPLAMALLPVFIGGVIISFRSGIPPFATENAARMMIYSLIFAVSLFLSVSLSSPLDIVVLPIMASVLIAIEIARLTGTEDIKRIAYITGLASLGTVICILAILTPPSIGGIVSLVILHAWMYFPGVYYLVFYMYNIVTDSDNIRLLMSIVSNIINIFVIFIVLSILINSTDLIITIGIGYSVLLLIIILIGLHETSSERNIEISAIGICISIFTWIVSGELIFFHFYYDSAITVLGQGPVKVASYFSLVIYVLFLVEWYMNRNEETVIFHEDDIIFPYRDIPRKLREIRFIMAIVVPVSGSVLLLAPWVFRCPVLWAAIWMLYSAYDLKRQPLETGYLFGVGVAGIACSIIFSYGMSGSEWVYPVSVAIFVIAYGVMFIAVQRKKEIWKGVEYKELSGVREVGGVCSWTDSSIGVEREIRHGDIRGKLSPGGMFFGHRSWRGIVVYRRWFAGATPVAYVPSRVVEGDFSWCLTRAGVFMVGSRLFQLTCKIPGRERRVAECWQRASEVRDCATLVEWIPCSDVARIDVDSVVRNTIEEAQSDPAKAMYFLGLLARVKVPGKLKGVLEMERTLAFIARDYISSIATHEEKRAINMVKSLKYSRRVKDIFEPIRRGIGSLREFIKEEKRSEVVVIGDPSIWLELVRMLSKDFKSLSSGIRYVLDVNAGRSHSFMKAVASGISIIYRDSPEGEATIAIARVKDVNDMVQLDKVKAEVYLMIGNSRLERYVPRFMERSEIVNSIKDLANAVKRYLRKSG